jgi:hypothetical protein
MLLPSCTHVLTCTGVGAVSRLSLRLGWHGPLLQELRKANGDLRTKVSQLEDLMQQLQADAARTAEAAAKQVWASHCRTQQSACPWHFMPYCAAPAACLQWMGAGHTRLHGAHSNINKQQPCIWCRPKSSAPCSRRLLRRSRSWQTCASR